MKYPFTALMLMLTLTASGQQQVRAEHGKFEVSGKLVNALTGELVRNAFVQLSGTAQSEQAPRSEVSRDGSFAFHDLAPGKYSLMAQARNFPPQFLDQHEAFSTAVAVGFDKTSTGIVFRLQPQSSISGRVLDEHNEPVREARVMLFEKNNDTGRRKAGMRGQLQSDEQGEYHFNHLGPGTYYVAVAAQPWYRRYYQQQFPRKRSDERQNDPALDVAYPLTFYPNTTDSESAGAILLRSGDRITADFDLTPVPSLHLTVANTGPPGSVRIPNFQYLVFGEPAEFLQANMSGRDGELDISGIAPGDYLMLTPPGDGRNSPRSEHVSLRQSGALDLSSQENLEGIHGTIKFSGERSPNAYLEIVDLDSGKQMGSPIDQQQEFTINPEQPGRLAFSLRNAPGYAIRSIAANGGRVSGRTVEFSGKQPLELSIVVSEGVGKVNGTVLDGDRPVAGAMVVLIPQNIADNVPLFRRDQSDSDGTFTLPDVVPGRYTVVALENGWEMEWTSPDRLRPYLAYGSPVEITGKQQLDIKVAAH